MSIEFELYWLEANRKKLVAILDTLPEEKLYTIPSGFNNNTIWQMGHIVVSQQRMIYMRSDLPMLISTRYHDFFKNGSSPATWDGKPEVSEVKQSLLQTITQLKTDLNQPIFTSYDPLVHPAGFTVKNHLEGLTYSNLHEAEHTGTILTMLKILKESSERNLHI